MKIASRLGLFCAAVLIFLVLNSDAYKQGYFRDDDYDNAVWTPFVDSKVFVDAFVSPRYIQGNFRPVGHYFFKVLSNTYGMDFPKWVAWIHVIHFANLILIWLFARRLGAGILASCVGSAFFLVHAAIVEVVWQPMYVFDQFCTLFGLGCLILYHRRQYVLSFVAFWIALKAKEPALVLPLSLFAIEYWFGGRKWWRPVPFLLAGLSFGIQGIIANRNAQTTYSLSISPASLVKTISFYSSEIWVIPFAGLLLLAIPYFVRNRAVWLGILIGITTITPVLLIANRISGAYLYLPLAGLAVGIACFAESQPVLSVLAVFLAWSGLNLTQLDKNQRAIKHQANSNRAYVQTLSEKAPQLPPDTLYMIDTNPEQFHLWGIRAVLEKILKKPESEIHLETVQNGDAFMKLSDPKTAHLVWIGEQQRLEILQRPPAAPLLSFLDFSRPGGEWQLGEGWHYPDQGVRWAEVFATAMVERPANESVFNISVDVIPELLRAEGKVRLLVLHPPDIIGNVVMEKPGPYPFSWPAPAGRGGPARLEFLIGPDYTKLPDAQRPLALRIRSFGFVQK